MHTYVPAMTQKVLSPAALAYEFSFHLSREVSASQADMMLNTQQRKAFNEFSKACAKVGYVIPGGVCNVLDNLLAGRDDLTEEKEEETALVKRHCCYTQWARNLRESVLLKLRHLNSFLLQNIY